MATPWFPTPSNLPLRVNLTASAALHGASTLSHYPPLKSVGSERVPFVAGFAYRRFSRSLHQPQCWQGLEGRGLRVCDRRRVARAGGLNGPAGASSAFPWTAERPSEKPSAYPQLSAPDNPIHHSKVSRATRKTRTRSPTAGHCCERTRFRDSAGLSVSRRSRPIRLSQPIRPV